MSGALLLLDAFRECDDEHVMLDGERVRKKDIV
jgi:hypothetical protein